MLCEETPLLWFEAIVAEYRRYTVECLAFVTYDKTAWPKDMPTCPRPPNWALNSVVVSFQFRITCRTARCKLGGW